MQEWPIEESGVGAMAMQRSASKTNLTEDSVSADARVPLTMDVTGAPV